MRRYFSTSIDANGKQGTGCMLMQCQPGLFLVGKPREKRQDTNREAESEREAIYNNGQAGGGSTAVIVSQRTLFAADRSCAQQQSRLGTRRSSSDGRSQLHRIGGSWHQLTALPTTDSQKENEGTLRYDAPDQAVRYR